MYRKRERDLRVYACEYIFEEYCKKVCEGACEDMVEAFVVGEFFVVLEEEWGEGCATDF